MKAYVKPELFYEQFELSKHIADCAFELTSNDVNSCYAKPDHAKLEGFGDWLVFTSANGVCNYPLDDIYCEFAGGNDFGNTFKS